jgi:superoxide dismutase, Fe-Mn family
MLGYGAVGKFSSKFLNAILILSVCCTIIVTNVKDAIAAPFTLPNLSYRYSALEPHIDTETMQLHHDKHHAAYVNNLNKAIEKFPALKDKTLTELLENLDQVPEEIRTVVRNNAGGHFNHSMYWITMSPKGGGQPAGKLAAAITKTFSSFEQFQQAFEDAGASRFGSGWVWLVKSKAGELKITTTPNQDAPFAEGTPIMGNDVWEHAYYLKYRNRRPEYQKAWWNVVNWSEVGRRFEAAA